MPAPYAGASPFVAIETCTSVTTLYLHMISTLGTINFYKTQGNESQLGDCEIVFY